MSEKPSGNMRVAAWMTLTVVLVIELIGGIVLLWSVLQAFSAATNDPLGQRLSVLLSAFIALAWIVITLIGTLFTRAGWARGSAMTLHVLMFAVGTGGLQGLLSPLLAWGLIVCALAGFFAAVAARPTLPTESE